MKIGLPRAFLYYKYKKLWEVFFEELGCQIVVSEESNKKILSDGINLSIDESCLPSKIYMGHVQSLIGKCDYILVPRIASFGKGEMACTKFNAMYDIVKNTLQGIHLIDYNIDVNNGNHELQGFLHMGKVIGKGNIETLKAYINAKKQNRIYHKSKVSLQSKVLESSKQMKILIVSHPYNTYDKLIGYPIIKYLKELDVIPIYADLCNSKESIKHSKELSKCLYWTFNKELIGAIEIYKDNVDGIIFITAFPCGPDSLVNELVLRKFKELPMANIILDELQGEAGLQTRIESFIDIIRAKHTMNEATHEDSKDLHQGKLESSII